MKQKLSRKMFDENRKLLEYEQLRKQENNSNKILLLIILNSNKKTNP